MERDREFFPDMTIVYDPEELGNQIVQNVSTLKLLSDEVDSDVNFWSIDIDRINLEAWGLFNWWDTSGWHISSGSIFGPHNHRMRLNYGALDSYEAFYRKSPEEIVKLVRSGQIRLCLYPLTCDELEKKSEPSKQSKIHTKSITINSRIPGCEPILSEIHKSEDGQWHFPFKPLRGKLNFSVPSTIGYTLLKEKIIRNEIRFKTFVAFPLPNPFIRRAIHADKGQKLSRSIFNRSMTAKHLPRTIGLHPTSGKVVSCHMSMSGPMVQHGEDIGDLLPTWAPLLPGQFMEDITLDQAISALQTEEKKMREEVLRKEARVLGKHNGQEVSVYCFGFSMFEPAREILVVKRGDVKILLKGEVGEWDTRKITLAQALRFIENEKTHEN